MKVPKIESRGNMHRFVWRCNGVKQRFSHEDRDLVVQAAQYVAAMGPNRITGEDPYLRTGRFRESETFALAHEQAEALAAEQRTFAAIAERVIVERENAEKIKDDTAKWYRSIVEKDLADWAERDVSTFSNQDLVDKRKELREAKFDHRGKPLKDGYAPKVVANKIGFARGVLYYATVHGLSEHNATLGFDHDRNPPRRRTDRFIERKDWDQVVAQAEPDVELMFDTMAETGIRIGEARGLQVRHAVLNGRRPYIDVLQQLDKHNRIAPPKFDSFGKVSIPVELAERLREHIGRRPRAAWLFTTPSGQPWWYSNLYDTRWVPMVQKAKAAGILADDEILTPHDLRHSHGSWLLNSGVPMLTVSRRLRHSSIQVTIDIYGHEDGGSNDKVMEALSKR